MSEVKVKAMTRKVAVRSKFEPRGCPKIFAPH
jgi:hypothetical protein